jgi:NAD(P)H-flavin reductase
MLENKTAVIKNLEYLTKKILYLRLEMKDPIELEFKSGQYINIAVAPNIRRSYSIGSPSYEKGHIELYIDVSPDGPGSKYFKSLKLNDEVEFLGPIGTFTLPTELSKDLYFIATGTGIAPFRSMCMDLLKVNFQGKIHLIFGLRYIEDIFLLDNFTELKKEHDNFNFEIILSKPENESWRGRVGHVQDCLDFTKIDLNNSKFFICGGQKMIFDVANLLKANSVLPENIYFEKFY